MKTPKLVEQPSLSGKPSPLAVGAQMARNFGGRTLRGTVFGDTVPWNAVHAGYAHRRSWSAGLPDRGVLPRIIGTFKWELPQLYRFSHSLFQTFSCCRTPSHHTVGPVARSRPHRASKSDVSHILLWWPTTGYTEHLKARCIDCWSNKAAAKSQDCMAAPCRTASLLPPQTSLQHREGM